MDAATIAIIASNAVSAIATYLDKSADKIVEEGAKEAFNKRAEIWNKVKGLFAPDELTTLKLFEENPEDARIQGKLEGKLEEKLKLNLEVAAELDALLKNLPAIQAKQNTQTITGDGNIAVQDVSGSNININK